MPSQASQARLPWHVCSFAKRDFDAVLLDVNLGGEYNPETADLLLEMGVPFAFVTGYDYVVEPRHDNVATAEALLIHSATGSRRATAQGRAVGGGIAQTV